MSFLNRLPAEQYKPDVFDGFGLGPFSTALARPMAWLAQLVYEDDAQKIDSILNLWHLRRVATFDRPAATTLPLTNTRGFLVEGHDAWFLTFEGTDPLVIANWVTNFSFRLNQDGVHQGFDAALQAAWPDVATALRAAGPAIRLFVVGHSLGGALAALAAVRIRKESGLVADGIYTFGMPRIGNPAFAQAYDEAFGERTYRLVHGEDIVPTVPPSNFNFRHVGRLLHCERHTKFDAALLAPPGSDDPAFADRLLSAVKVGLAQLLSGSLGPEIRPDFLGRASRLLTPAIADHLPDRYWAALEPGGA